MKEQLAAGLGEGQVAEPIEHDEVEPGQMTSDLMFFMAAWCGFNEAERLFEIVGFENNDGYQPKRDYGGLTGILNVPPSYVRANSTR
jgi:hypothetical protein